MQLRSLASIAALMFSMTVPIMQAQDAGAPAPPAEIPSAPEPTATPAPGTPMFPPTDASNFTAASPARETVEAFLKQSFGYDSDRVWQVQAIQPTPAPGVSKVIVLLTQKSNPTQIANLSFFVTPDGKHLISDDVLPFGAHPWAEFRKLLETEATGPSKGAAPKTLLFVEFADFKCPYCKTALPLVDRLLADYPNAHYVFQIFPVHDGGAEVGAYGLCALKQGGNEAFYRLSAALFENQEKLTGPTSKEAMRDAATKANLDPSKLEACSVSAEAKAEVDGSAKLGARLNVHETPTLFVNGRGIPMGLPYETLKKIIDFLIQQP
jgi:protein-disulfide isomerase